MSVETFSTSSRERLNEDQLFSTASPSRLTELLSNERTTRSRASSDSRLYDLDDFEKLRRLIKTAKKMTTPTDAFERVITKSTRLDSHFAQDIGAHITNFELLCRSFHLQDPQLKKDAFRHSVTGEIAAYIDAHPEMTYEDLAKTLRTNYAYKHSIDLRRPS